MALVALTNDRWGFRSKCFVCEPANPTGLRIPFFHDDAGGLVRADFTLTEARILDGKDRVCAQADATFVPLDAAQAAAAVGTTVGGPDSAFVVDHPSIAR